MEIKIIHTADIHFDTAFSGLSGIDKASVRRQDLRRTFSKIISLADRGDMLFISGDLFDGKHVSRTTLDFLKKEFAKIPHVKVFIAAGNHDCFDAQSVYTRFNFGENVHVFSTEAECVETEQADVYGISFKAANEHRELLSEISIKNPDKINLLVMHGNLAGEGYNPIKPAELENCGMDYVALGHIHLSNGVERRGKCTFAYPGCPEGRGFDETGEKGVLALTVSKNHIKSDFIPTCERMYLEIPVDVSGIDGTEEIIGRIKEQLTGAEHIYRIRLTGESQFPIDTEILKHSVEAFDVSVVDETTPAVDVEGLSEEFTLKGLFAKFALEEKDAMDPEDFERAFTAGFTFIEKEERNENR